MYFILIYFFQIHIISIKGLRFCQSVEAEELGKRMSVSRINVSCLLTCVL